MKKMIKRGRASAASNNRVPATKNNVYKQDASKQPAVADSATATQCTKIHGQSPTNELTDGYVKANRVNIIGATAPDGTPWIKFSAEGCDRHSWIRLDDLSDDAAPAKKRLRSDNIILFNKDLTKAIDDGRAVTEFPSLPLIDKLGWSGGHFALRSGEVFSPNNQTEAIVLFQQDRVTCSAKGSSKWLKDVKQVSKGQPLVTFALMVPFAGPLLAFSRVIENPCWEWSGPKGVGKTTIQNLATSIWGPALEPAGRNHWISANTTINALEAELPRHADMLMVIEELSVMHAGESERVRASKMREFVFRTAQGTVKDRHQQIKTLPSRFVWMTTTNDPIAVLLSKVGGDAAEAAGDRILALPISRTRKHGIFKAPLPKGCSTGEDAARCIATLVSENYGLPIRHFLKQLVPDRARNEVELRSKIEAWILQFREAVGVDGNVGSEARVADAFGLVYAAGMLARQYGALPKKLDCMAAAIKCYRINRKSVGADVSNVQRLQRLAKRKGVVIINLDDRSKAYRERVSAAPALLRISKGGTRELLLSSEQFEKAFPKRKALLADPAVKKIMRHDKDRSTLKTRVVHNGPQKRFRCFDLSAIDT